MTTEFKEGDSIWWLYPPKVGLYNYNQLVYIVETNGNSVGIKVSNSLVIDKGYVKAVNTHGNQYLIGSTEHSVHDIVSYDAAAIYAFPGHVKYALNKWLDSGL